MSQTINEIKRILLEANPDELQSILRDLKEDPRQGVRALIQKYEKEEKAMKKELERLDRMMWYEQKYAEYSFICGIDEVGRGPLSGPVIAGAVILPKNATILYLNDSKQVSPQKREALYDEIMDKAVATGIGIVSGGRIDEINILNATYEAMRLAISNLSVPPDLLLNDAVTIPTVSVKQVAIIKGDEKSVSIAAASIIAKVTRDRMMVEYHKLYPVYQFDKNKGYGSKDHISALKQFGTCPIHRNSFLKNFELSQGKE